MAEPQLINLMNNIPFFTYKNEGIEIRSYTAQDLYMAEKYVARGLPYFEKSGSSVLYISTTIRAEDKDFVFKIPQVDKRFVKEWTKEQWVELVYLLHRKDKVEKDLKDINEALMGMKIFSDIRKIAKHKQKELKQELKSVKTNIKEFLTDIRDKGNEKIVFQN